MVTRRLPYRDGDQVYPILSFYFLAHERLLGDTMLSLRLPVFLVGDVRHTNYEGVRIKVIV